MWIIFLILGLVLLLLVLSLVLLWKYVRNYWTYLEVPHEPPQPLLDVCKAFTQVGHSPCGGGVAATQHYAQLYEQFKGTGPFCGFYHLLQPRVLVLDRELVTQILIKDFSNFNDRGGYHNSKEDPLSGDLYNLTDNKWREMRGKLEPIFSKEQMELLYPGMCVDGDKLLHAFDAALKGAGVSGAFMEVHPLIRRYVLSSIANCVFGLGDAEHQSTRHSLDEFDAMTTIALCSTRYGNYASALLSRYRKLGRRMGFASTPRQAEKYFLTLIEDVVRQRESYTGVYVHDYLQLLINLMTQELSTHDSEMHANAKELKTHLMEELYAHAFVFLRAGFTPTTQTLSYVLYELALHVDVQQRVRQEVQDALLKHGNALSFECVQELKFMGQVISETLRLHPVTPYIIRRTLNDYRVPNHFKYHIRKDMYVIIPSHAMHNDPANYPEPHVFRPERFAASANKTRDHCTWFGFGEGPRNCIGVRFAQLQIRIALARLITEYRFTLDMQRLVINCHDGVTLHVERINAGATAAHDFEDSGGGSRESKVI